METPEALAAASQTIKSTWINDDSSIWETVYAFAKEFGWSAHYTLKEVPLLWIKRLTVKMIECAEAQKEAAKGHRTIPKSELSDERIEKKNRMLAEATGQNYDEIHSKSVYG